MKITFLAASAQLGGAERVLLDLLAGLRAFRPHWSLTLCTPSTGPLMSRAAQLDVPAIVVPFPARFAACGGYAGRRLSMAAAAPSAIAYALRLRTALRHLDPDVIHSNGVKTHIAAAWCTPTRTRLVWHLHDYVSRRIGSAALLRRSVGGCRAIVANSQSVASDAHGILGDGPRPQVIRNGVNVREFTPTGETRDLDAMAGMPPAPPRTLRAGLIATYARWKGHLTFLQALARLPGDAPVRGYVIGGPIYETHGSQHTRAELERETVRLGLHSRVGFVDFVDDPAPAFRSLDIVVHASTEPEPFGLVIAEAMACGKATIAADAGAVAEILRPGVDGLLHRPGDVDGLAVAIRTLAHDPSLRRRLGLEARRSAERRLSRDRFASEFCQVYEDISSAKTARRSQPPIA